MNPVRRRSGLLFVFLAAALLVLAVCPFVGMQSISPADVWQTGSYDDTAAMVFWQIRVPRVLLAFLAGAGLGICGMAFQAMFRNPLATPFTLGVASGASLGAALYVRLGLALALVGISGVTLFAFLGALAAISLVYLLTQFRRGFSAASMLLAGVAVNFFFSSLILFMQYLSDFTGSFRIVRWLMGGVEIMGYDELLNAVPFVTVGAVVVFLHTRELNLLSTGDDLAASRGVDVARTKKTLFAATSLAIAGVVALCGPIGFIGMMAPHICRLLVGSNHRVLFPATLLFGGTFLVLCDTLARTLIAPAEIPVGVITALLGGPFFLWLLLHLSGPDRKSLH